MNLEQRTDLLEKLSDHILSDDPAWVRAKERASYENPWFVPDFIARQLKHIASAYLDRDALHALTETYKVPVSPAAIKTIGVVMAGNIPLAGFHDFLCTFLSGHRQLIKASSKDQVLIRAIVSAMQQWNPEVERLVSFSEQLKGCDAYIATGSNNSARYFDYYFSKYPHIIRRNRTSAAILSGHETLQELQQLADDVYLYFGLGCRNVTKIYVPPDYDFVPLLEAFKKYDWVAEHHKYKNNYDYQLAIMIINKLYYMTNGSILLQQNPSLFSPISQLHYGVYTDRDQLAGELGASPDIQCVSGTEEVPFGKAQQPGLADFADRADTLQFLLNL